MANGRKTVTNENIFDRIESLRLEVKADAATNISNVMAEIRALRTDFNKLESGRVTALETQFRDFQLLQSKRDAALSTSQATMSGKLVIIWSMIGAIFVAFVTATAYKVVGKR